MKAWAELITAMTKLDNSIPDHVFNDGAGDYFRIDDPQELADNISGLWNAISHLQKHYGVGNENLNLSEVLLYDRDI